MLLYNVLVLQFCSCKIPTLFLEIYDLLSKSQRFFLNVALNLHHNDEYMISIKFSVNSNMQITLDMVNNEGEKEMVVWSVSKPKEL